MDFVKYFKEKAKSDIQRIVLAEGTEERTLKAADIVLGEGFADLIILSKPEFIKKYISIYIVITSVCIIGSANSTNKCNGIVGLR